MNYLQLYMIKSPDGTQIQRFANTCNADGTPVKWGGNTFNKLPVQSTGWGYSSTSKGEKVTISVSNVNNYFTALMASYSDFVGWSLTMYETYDKYLDNGSSPDTTIYPNTSHKVIIEQLVSQDEKSTVWQCCALSEVSSRKYPGRMITRDGDSRYCKFPGV